MLVLSITLFFVSSKKRFLKEAHVFDFFLLGTTPKKKVLLDSRLSKRKKSAPSKYYVPPGVRSTSKT